MQDCVMCEVEASLQHRFSELYEASRALAFENDPGWGPLYDRCYWINNDILMLQGKQDKADA